MIDNQNPFGCHRCLELQSQLDAMTLERDGWKARAETNQAYVKPTHIESRQVSDLTMNTAKIFKILKKHAPMAKKDLSRKSQFLTMEERELAINELVRNDKIECKVIPGVTKTFTVYHLLKPQNNIQTDG